MSAAEPEVGGTRAVALGGGHGLAASLVALRRAVDDVTAVVTVADDGGSSGRLRAELGGLPPGDLRMALAALCPDTDAGRVWRDVLQHRFPGEGALGGHAAGNLLLRAYWDVVGDGAAGLESLTAALGISGRVLPMAEVPLEIVADVVLPGHDEPGQVVGQAEVAVTPGQVLALRLQPEAPPACPQAVAAIRDADLVVLGPGSWFTSVLTHLLVPGLHEALVHRRGRLVVVLNLAPQPGETAGFSPETHLDVLAAHAPDLVVDVVVADPRATPDPDALLVTARALGARLLLADVGHPDGSPTHDPDRLAAALRAALDSDVDGPTRADPPSTRSATPVAG